MKACVTKVKDKIKEKTGKWERLLLKGNRGRRWFACMREDGKIPRSVGDFVLDLKTMIFFFK